MSIVTPVDVAVAIGESDPRAPTKTYTFKNVKGCNGCTVKELPVTFNIEWASYWTEDRRVCPPAPPPTRCAMIMDYIRLPFALVAQLVMYLVEGLFMIVAAIISLLCMPVMAAVAFCLYKRAAPVLTHNSFYYWLQRNGFTSEEMKKVKEAAKSMTMHTLVHRLTDVRAVEEIFKLQSVEKQKLVVVVLQQSKEAIVKAHQKEFELLRIQYTGAIFSWGAEDSYKLGDVIAKNGRLCSRGEDARKKGDWEQRVASKVNLRVNAVLRCINTIANDGCYSEYDVKMKDLVRTVNRTDNPVDWTEFVVKNKNHDNKLLGEIHTAAPYIKQYVTHAIVTESYPSRVARVCWSWSLLFMLVVLRLAKAIVKLIFQFDIDGIGDVIDLIVGVVTELSEAPVGLLDILENGLPVNSGAIGINDNGVTGSMMDTLDAKFGRDARLENKEAQLKASMKSEKVTELIEEQNPVVSVVR